MALNSRLGIFHPRFAYHPRPTVNSAMISRVEIYKPTGVRAGWTPGEGMSDEGFELVWRGQARIQPNKDWRARPRDFANEIDAVHAVRVQIPIGKNEVGAILDVYDNIVTYGPDPDGFFKDYRVDLIYMPTIGSESWEGKSVYVRNALNSGNQWLYNLLCDSGTNESE